MWKIFGLILTIGVVSNVECGYEDKIVFTVFNALTGTNFISKFDKTLTSQGCNPNGKFAIITHGYLESINRKWVMELVKNLLSARGGCVIFMDYASYSSFDYVGLRLQFKPIADVLLKKLKQLEQEGFKGENGYGFGFSFGARLMTEACVNFGSQKMKNVDLCDPAGPGFDFIYDTKDPKKAAKNVQCINTSNNLGSSIYNCHQNWRMGSCGLFQPAAPNDLLTPTCVFPNKCFAVPLMSHNLCLDFYNSAFKNTFNNSNPNGCLSLRKALNVPVDYKMGYNETKTSSISGDLFSLTGLVDPWTI